MKRFYLLISLVSLLAVAAVASETKLSPGLMENSSITLVPADGNEKFDEISVESLFSFESDNASFGIDLCGMTDTVSVILTRITSDRFTDFESTAIKTTVTFGLEKLLDKMIDTGFGLSGGEVNSLTVSIEDNRIILSGGYRQEFLLSDRPLTDFIPQTVRIFNHGRVDVSSVKCITFCSPQLQLATSHTLASLEPRFKSAHDPVEGFWKYLDRQNNPRYARPGGSYTLAVVADGEGGYDIIYISGAEVYADRWHEGMIKGHLRPTIFEGHYDLEWVDSTFTVHDRELSAQFDSAGILTLNFPLLKTQIRLSRLKPDSL